MGQKYGSDELVLDAICRLNRKPHFFPAGGALMPELRRSELTGNSNGMLNSLREDLPGYRVIINVKQKTARIEDRMTYPEHDDLRQRLAHQVRGERGGFQRIATDAKDWKRDYAGESIVRPTPDDIRMTPDDDATNNLATWLYWARRLVDEGKFRIVTNSNLLPSLEQCQERGPVMLSEANEIVPKNPDKPFNILPQTKPVNAGGAKS